MQSSNSNDLMINADLPPVVFIHGWKSSVLVSKTTGNVMFDYTFDRLTGIKAGDVLSLPCEWDKDSEGRQREDDIEALRPCYDVKCLCGTVTLAKLCGPMLQNLRAKGRDVREFTYDWRRELGETSAAFEAFLQQVKGETGKQPQVIGQSMGCLIALHVLNRNPELFHSVLFGAGAISPTFSLMEEISFFGGLNKVGLNDKMFNPSQHLTNPGPFHMLTAYPDERKLFGKEHVVMLEDAAGNPVDVDLRSIDFWKKHQLGMYHPSSGVEITTAKEEWLGSILQRCHKFRSALVPKFPESQYPPVAVLNSDGLDTKFKFVLDNNGYFSGSNVAMLPGDGRVIYEDSLPPKGIPVSMKITNKREHIDVLNDLEAVDKLIAHLISSKK
jgi:pimeloyl-ACP methyl ester carboxylesterase